MKGIVGIPCWFVITCMGGIVFLCEGRIFTMIARFCLLAIFQTIIFCYLLNIQWSYDKTNHKQTLIQTHSDITQYQQTTVVLYFAQSQFKKKTYFFVRYYKQSKYMYAKK